MSLLGIDVGSGSIKAVAFTTGGDIVGQAVAGYPTSYLDDGRVEASPSDLWEAFAGVCRSVGRKTKADPVESLAIVSHGETIIPLDDGGAAVGPAIMNADNRATDEIEELTESLGREDLYRITGVPPHPMYSLPKIMWLKRRSPRIYKRTGVFAAPAGYLQARLGLPPAIDHSLAGRTMAFDLDEAHWSQAVLDAAGIPAAKLPVIQPAGTILGRLSRATASAVGLPGGIVVALGGHDQPCGALGAGCFRAGQAADSAGTYECMTVVSRKRPHVAEALKYSLNTCRHVAGGLYATLAFFPAGALTRWFLDAFIPEHEQKKFFAEAEKQVGRLGARPTGICVLPHIVGACTPAWDTRATGVIVGLTPRAGRWQLYKAMFEGFACELDLNIEAVENTIGPVASLRIFGGNSRHAFSIQLRADVTGRRFEVMAHPEAVCMGAAMLAGVAAGRFNDAGTAAKEMDADVTICRPDPVSARLYGPQKRRYRMIYPALEPVRAMKEQ